MKKIITLVAPLFYVSVNSAYAQMEPPPQGYVPAPQGYVQQQPAYVQQPPVVVAQPYCQPYSDSFTMGGEKRITRGTACLQPDGSWQLHPQQAAVNYVNRNGVVFIMPVRPFAVVVRDGHEHHRHHDDDHHDR